VGSCHISPRDIWQATTDRPGEVKIRKLAKNVILYYRSDIRAFVIRKNKPLPIPASIMTNWIATFPKTVEALEQEGWTIQFSDEAMAVIEEKEKEK